MFNKFKSASIAIKLPVTIVSIATVAVLATGILSYQGAQGALEYEGLSKVQAIAEARKSEVQHWFDSINKDLHSQVENPTIRDALKQFSRAWDGIEGNKRDALQRLYITENPHPTGQKENLDSATDGSEYSWIHSKYHPYIRTFLRDRGYYDIFLFDTDGNLVYSVYKELDYATNMNTGKWSKTDLANSFRAAANNSSNPSFTAFFDFKPYGPSHGAPASFISKPVFDDNGTYIGVTGISRCRWIP